MPTSPPRRRAGRPARPIERHELIAIARAIFADEGYSGASLSKIAEAAGLRKASLYHHFSTKQSLYLAVLDDVLGDLTELIAEARMDHGDFVERLDRLGGLVVDYLGAHPDAARLLLREMVGEGEFVREHGAAAVDVTLTMTAAFLEAGMQAGAFRRQDPKQLTLSITGLHLVYFAASGVVAPFVGGDLGSAALLQERKRAVLAQVRALCAAER